MKTSGDNPDGSIPKRGACVECKRPETVDQVLISFDGGKGCVCAECAKLPEYAKRLK